MLFNINKNNYYILILYNYKKLSLKTKKYIISKFLLENKIKVMYLNIK